ncbi:MAG: hypothetical protein M0Z69_05795 [Actinomycetota bacterium]|nr:hypothetical protein [Actinomycetota bacterium]
MPHERIPGKPSTCRYTPAEKEQAVRLVRTLLAELAGGRLRAKIPELRRALEGRFSAHHALLVGQILAKLDFLDEAIATLPRETDRVIAPFADEVELLDTIPGVDRRLAECLVQRSAST